MDKKLSANLEKLKGQVHPFRYKIFTGLGHGGLAGEQPEIILEEKLNAHETQKLLWTLKYLSNWIISHCFGVATHFIFWYSISGFGAKPLIFVHWLAKANQRKDVS